MILHQLVRPRAARRGTLVALALLLLVPAISRAQPLADRVPGDAVLYVGWQGADAMPPAFAQSHLKAVLDASDLRKVFDEFIPALQRRAAQENAQASEAADLFASLAKPMWRFPTAFFVGGIEWPAAGGQPMPKLGLICQAGPEAGAMMRKIDGLIKQGPPDVQKLVKVTVIGDLLLISVGYDDNPLAEAGPAGKSLANAASYKAAAAGAGKTPVVVAFLDVERLLAEADAAAAKVAPPEAKEQVAKMLGASGLTGLKQVIWTSGPDGADWGDHVFIRAPEPRKGFLSLGEPTYVSDAALALIPQTATMAGASKFSISRSIAGFRELAVGFDPDAGPQFDQALAQASDALGMDVQKDFLAVFGDEWLYYTDPAVGGRGVMGIVGINRLKDAAKAGAALAKLEGMANAILAEQLKNEEAKVQFYTTTTKVGGADVVIHYAGLPLISPAWAVHGGNLYFGLFPQTVAAALDSAAAKGKTILDNPDFLALRKRLGGQNGNSISFMDLPRTAPDAYAQWTMVSRLSGLADMFGVQSPTMILPPLSRLMPHLSPAGSVSWTDKEGWHMRAVTPFPGAMLLASDPITTMYTSGGPLMVSILLPSINRAREQANRVQSASNLRQIGMASVMYAQDNQGKMAPSLAEIIKTQEIAPGVFLNPRASSSARPPQFRIPDELAAWVTKNSDYVWIGAGLTNAQGPEFILAYEKPQGLTDGINIVYADCHVEFQFMAAAQAQLEGQAALRKKAGLPPAPKSPGFGNDGVQ